MARTILERALAGDPFHDLDIIDMHCHMGPNSEYWFPEAEIDAMLADCDRVGIRQVFVCPHIALYVDHLAGNRQTEAAIALHPDRVRGYVCFNPHLDVDDSEIHRCYENPGFIGVKVHPSAHRYPLNGPRYQPMFAALREYGGFLLAHTWQTDPNCSSALFDDIASTYPDINIVLAHAFGLRDGVFEAIRLVNRYPNLYLDTSGCDFSHTAIEEIVAAADPGKILFGSDLPYHDVRMPVSRIFFADMDDSLKLRVLRDNILELLAKSPVRVVR